jgi:hypothetical protein
VNPLAQATALGKSAKNRASRVSRGAETRPIRHEVRSRFEAPSIAGGTLTREEVDKLLRSPAGLITTYVREQHLPRLPPTLRCSDLPPNVRVQTCLKNLEASQGITLGKLHQLTVGRLLETKNFGWKSLVDLLSSVAPMILDCARASSGDSSKDCQPMSAPVTEAAQRLGAQPYSVHIRCTDPRFMPEVGMLLYAANSSSEAAPLDASASLHSVASRLVGRSREVFGPENTLGVIRRLRRKIADAQKMTLETELKDITQALAKGRDIGIIVSSLGGSGQGAKALQAVGDEFSITRERVRQILHGFTQEVQRARPFAPTLRRAIVQISKRLPAAAGDLQEEMRRLGLTQSLFRLDGVISAAEILGLSIPFVMENHRGMWVVVRREDAGLAKTIVQVARKRVSHAGLSKLAGLRDQVRQETGVSIGKPLLKSVLQSLPSLHWLDEECDWFFLEDVQRNHLVTRVTKLLSVAPRISVREIRASIANDHRVKGLDPPKSVILEFCRVACNADLDGDYLIASQAPLAAEVLSEGEQLAYSVLLNEGPFLDRGAFERKCIERGMNRNTFAAYVRRLPIVARYAPGVYGLRGARG